LTVTAFCELGAALALLALPSLAISLLLGSPMNTPGGLVIARMAGVALLSLGVVCWIARSEGGGRTLRGLVAAMLIYNLGAVLVLAHARLGFGLDGVGLWPAVLLHFALSIWCVTCLQPKAAAPASK
jgi:hypothetical protein